MRWQAPRICTESIQCWLSSISLQFRKAENSLQFRKAHKFLRFKGQILINSSANVSAGSSVFRTTQQPQGVEGKYSVQQHIQRLTHFWDLERGTEKEKNLVKARRSIEDEFHFYLWVNGKDIKERRDCQQMGLAVRKKVHQRRDWSQKHESPCKGQRYPTLGNCLYHQLQTFFLVLLPFFQFNIHFRYVLPMCFTHKGTHSLSSHKSKIHAITSNFYIPSFSEEVKYKPLFAHFQQLQSGVLTVMASFCLP